MNKHEQSNRAHNLQYVNQLLNDILELHSDLYQKPKKESVTFDEALAVLKWFEATVVEIFEKPEDLVCQECASKNKS